MIVSTIQVEFEGVILSKPRRLLLNLGLNACDAWLGEIVTEGKINALPHNGTWRLLCQEDIPRPSVCAVTAESYQLIYTPIPTREFELIKVTTNLDGIPKDKSEVFQVWIRKS